MRRVHDVTNLDWMTEEDLQFYRTFQRDSDIEIDAHKCMRLSDVELQQQLCQISSFNQFAPRWTRALAIDAQLGKRREVLRSFYRRLIEETLRTLFETQTLEMLCETLKEASENPAISMEQIHEFDGEKTFEAQIEF